jgi:hypothetical protein
MGLAPVTAEEGDSICVFLGADVPFILRKEGDCHVVVGQAYIDAYMHKSFKAFRKSLRDGVVELKTFWLR